VNGKGDWLSTPICGIVGQPMEPEMNLSLEKGLRDYIDRQVKTGRFETPADVIKDALVRQMDYFARREALLTDLDAGLGSIEAGRSRHVTADDIRRIAAERKKSA